MGESNYRSFSGQNIRFYYDLYGMLIRCNGSQQIVQTGFQYVDIHIKCDDNTDSHNYVTLTLTDNSRLSVYFP